MAATQTHQEIQTVYKIMLRSMNEVGCSPTQGNWLTETATRFSYNPPVILRQFVGGFASYPIHWWVATLHLMALNGVFGVRNQINAKTRQTMVSTILRSGFQHPARSMRVVYWYTKHKVKSESVRVAGRFIGAGFTNITLTRLLFGRGLKGKKQLLLKRGNMLHTGYGAMLMAVESGIRSLEGLVWALLSGETKFSEMGIIRELKQLPELTSEEKAKISLLNSEITRAVKGILEITLYD